MQPSFFDSTIFTYFVLPLLIFCARICDVSIGTVRIIALGRGMRFLAPLLGFFEVLIWLMAIRQIMSHMSNPVCYLAYGGGFATGNYIGLLIEEKLAFGAAIIRVITKEKSRELVANLRGRGYGVTILEGEGIDGKVDVIFTIVNRSDVKEVIKTVQGFNPRAFYTVEDVRSVSEVFSPHHGNHFNLLRSQSKESDK